MKRMMNEEEQNKMISASVLAKKSTDELLKLNDFIDTFSTLRAQEKLNNTYIKNVREALKYNGNGRIYVDYRIDGTATGRLSNAGYNDGETMGVSFHTLPREGGAVNIRSYVIAPEGWDFITADMKAMELRILAHLANEKNMSKAFIEGKDLHKYSAAMTFAKSEDKVTTEERQIAKAVSFLVIYGGTEHTLSRKQGIPLKAAEGIISSWMSAFPGVPRYMEKVFNFIKDNRYAYTIFGRRRHLPNITARMESVQKQALRQGLNFTVQSAASDTILCCIIGLNRLLKSSGMQAKIIATVHDSIEIICPKEETKQVLSMLYREMTEYSYIRENFGIKFKVPLEIDILVGDSFGSGDPAKKGVDFD